MSSLLCDVILWHDLMMKWCQMSSQNSTHMSDLCCCLAFLKNIASVFITDMVSSIMDIIVIILFVMFRFGHLSPMSTILSYSFDWSQPTDQQCSLMFIVRQFLWSPTNSIIFSLSMLSRSILLCFIITHWKSCCQLWFYPFIVFYRIKYWVNSYKYSFDTTKYIEKLEYYH